jgi:hypothetical protein
MYNFSCFNSDLLVNSTVLCILPCFFPFLFTFSYIIFLINAYFVIGLQAVESVKREPICI